MSSRSLYQGEIKVVKAVCPSGTQEKKFDDFTCGGYFGCVLNERAFLVTCQPSI